MALSHILAEMGKSAYIVYPDDKFPEHLVPFSTVEVYSPEQSESILTDATMTVDVAAPNQLRGNYDRYGSSISLMIDHHDNGTAMADNLTVPTAAAVGEIVFDIAEELIARGRISSLPRKAADALFLSISSDTGCFKYSNVTPKTHRIAARLIEMGVESAKINMLYFDSKSPEQIEAEKIAYNNIRILLDGKLVICALDKKTKAGIPNEHFENAVNIARSVRGALVSCAVKEKDAQEGSFRVSMRSNEGGANVAELCARFGGGGHVRAAGCMLFGELEEVIDRLQYTVSQYLE
jgi:phosphoesterase RecJ-like protein